LSDQVFENLSAVFETLKLIEAGAGGREQNRVTGLSVGRGPGNRLIERAGINQRHGAA
jgi:hypothetical protein